MIENFRSKSSQYLSFYLDLWKEHIEEFSNQHNVKIKTNQFDSDGLQVSVHRPAQYVYRIYFPVGVIQRFSLLSMIFRFSTKIPRVDNVISIMDRRDIDFYIPERLKLIFDPAATFCNKTATDLCKEYCDLEIDFTWEHSIGDAIFFLLHHELGHITSSHLEFLTFCQKNASDEITNSTLGFSEFDLRQGFEVSADQHAAIYFTSALLSKVKAFHKVGLSANSALTEIAITLALIVSLFDIRSRSLDVASPEYHPHPLLRFLIINLGMCENLSARGYDELAEQYWSCARKCGEGVSSKIGGLHWSELGLDQISENAFGAPAICPLRLDRNPIGESVLMDWLTRTAERGRRIDMRINLHKEFSYSGLAGLERGLKGDFSERWEHNYHRLSRSNAVRDQISSGARFGTFYGPVREEPGVSVFDQTKENTHESGHVNRRG